MAKEKKAFVFDTNFIIEYKKLNEVVEKLCEDFDVYVTQVSVDERIARKCTEERMKYAEIDDLKSEYKGIVSFKIIKTQEQRIEELKNAILNNYKKLFKENFIPLDRNPEIFSEVLNRAYDKVAPFSNAEGASDKGFKDSLIWISLLSYFKTKGNNSVILVTNDGGFIKNADVLCQEFKNVTGKTIEIKPNSYYKEICRKESQPNEKKETEPLPDLAKIREEVEEIIDALRWDLGEDCFGNDHWYNTFTLQKEVDSRYMEAIFSGLKSTIKEHIFEKFISASKILDLDDRVADATSISMEKLENAYHLYERILNNYPEFIEQFYIATAAIMNRSYKAPPPFSFANPGDDLPF